VRTTITAGGERNSQLPPAPARRDNSALGLTLVATAREAVGGQPRELPKRVSDHSRGQRLDHEANVWSVSTMISCLEAILA